MPNWKKLVVSGSDASLNSLIVNNAVTASFFKGDGTEITGVISSSYAISASYVDPLYISASAAAAGFSGTGGGGTGVTSIVAGEGISIDQSTGIVTISATPGVVPGTILTSSFSDVTSTFYNHNFNSKNIIAKIYDTNSNEVIPNSLTLTSNDRIDATFSSPQSGYIVIIKGTNLNTVTGSYVNSLTSSITHGLGTQDFNVSVYDENYRLVFPDTLTIPDTESIETTFSAPSTGTVVAVAKQNRITGTYTNQTSVSIPNTLNSLNVVVSVYDSQYSNLIPDNIRITTSSIDLDFAAPSTGNVVVAGGQVDATSITLSTSFKTSINGASIYNIQHNLDEEFPMVQVYESSSRAQFIPQSIISLDEDTIQLTFSAPFAGHVIINS